MMRFSGLLVALVVALAACEPTTNLSGSPQHTYRISSSQSGKIQFRMLDSVNTLRAAAGAPALTLNSQLTAAAATHSRDMANQNRPWHFGSDGSSPLDRAARAGYSGTLIGENISETFETELQTLAAWMEESGTRDVLLEPSATQMGFSWFQESNGKIWWTMVTGS